MQDIVREAGAMLKSAHLSTSEIHEKEGPANFCTDYDLRIQRFIMGWLAEVAPGCSSFGEEDTEGNHGSATSPYTFYIDPIDGTTNFMFDYHHSCVSVGVAYAGQLVAGVLSVKRSWVLASVMRSCSRYVHRDKPPPDAPCERRADRRAPCTFRTCRHRTGRGNESI